MPPVKYGDEPSKIHSFKIHSFIPTMTFDSRAKLFLFALLVITPAFYLKTVLDIALVPRFICWSVVLIAGVFLFIKEYPKTKYLKVLDGCFLLYYVISAFSLMWALNTAEAIFETQKIFAAFLTYLLLRFLLFKSEGRLIPFLLLCNIAITIIVLCSVFIQLAEAPTLFRLAYNNFRDIKGLSSQRNLVCSFLYLTLIFNVLAVSYFEKKTWRRAVLALIVVQVFILLLLQTRAVYIAIIISGITFLIGFQVITRYFNYKRILGFAAVLIILVSLVLGRLLLVDDDFNVYVEQFDITKYLTSTSASERINMWEKTTSMIQDKPLSGFGAGNWAIYYPSYGGYADSYAADKDIFYQRPHNDFLWVFSETGLLGFLAYLGIFIFAITLGLRAVYKMTAPDERLKVWILLSGLVGYLVIANFSFPKERIEHQIWLALLLSTLIFYTKQYFDKSPNLPFPKIDNRLLVLLAVAGLCLNLMIGYHRYKGESSMKYVYIESTPKQRKKQLLRKARSYFYNLDHVGFPLPWYAGIIASGESNDVQALKYFEEAYALNPYNFKVVNDLAGLYGRRQDTEQAKKYLMAAVKINPESQATIFNLAVLHYNLKDYKAAAEWARKLSDEYPRKKELLQRLQGK